MNSKKKKNGIDITFGDLKLSGNLTHTPWERKYQLSKHGQSDHLC